MKISDRAFWAKVDDINWPRLARRKSWTSRTSEPDRTRERLADEESFEYWEAFGRVATAKREALQQVVRDEGLLDELELGDDGFWDLTAHLVGSGREAYELALAEPRRLIGRARRHQFIENFEYVFPTEYQYEDEDD